MKPPVASLIDLSERPWVRTLALVVLIGATVFLLWRSDDPPAPSATPDELRGPAEPDGFVVDGHYRAYDAQGNDLYIGGTFGGIHFLKEWADYFPHVDEAQLIAQGYKPEDARRASQTASATYAAQLAAQQQQQPGYRR